jgi:Flp pilus assembly pilin Flp
MAGGGALKFGVRWRRPSVGSLRRVRNLLYRWLADDRGQDLVEYVLLTATIALAGLVVMNTFDDVMNVVYTSWDTGTQAIWEPQDPQ